MNDYNKPKSATTAGLLGIFLGSVGAHNWYLGDKKKGIIHVCLFGSGIVVELLASVILPMALSWSSLITMAGVLAALGGIAGIAMSANGIWGLVEGIIILSQGDAGLAAKGYPVASAVAQPYYGPQPQQYAQPYQPQPQQYAQPYQQPQQYGQQPIQSAEYNQQPQQNFQQPTQDANGAVNNEQQ